MFTKGMLERFIDRLETERQLPAREIIDFRRRLEGVFFNEYGVCSGEVAVTVFKGRREILERLSGQEAFEITDDQDKKQMLRYDRAVARKQPYITKAMITRFVDQLAGRKRDRKATPVMRRRLSALSPSTSLAEAGPQDGMRDIHSVAVAEMILQNMRLIRRFRKDCAKLMTPEDRERIEPLVEALRRPQQQIWVELGPGFFMIL